jgi:hypothetical protein
VVRVKGGLGNQMFCYAAARGLAIRNNAELVIDNITGFIRDTVYRRKYMLNHFKVCGRLASANERLEPFERYRRALYKYVSRAIPFNNRVYYEHNTNRYDVRYINLRFRRNIIMDGYWQGECYFKNAEQLLRNELELKVPPDNVDNKLMEIITRCNSVAIHVRRYDNAFRGKSNINLPYEYYKRAINIINGMVDNPYYIIFAESGEGVGEIIELCNDRAIANVPRDGDDNTCADMWLMTQCKNFIIANSTYSWWGAWLARKDAKVVVAPRVNRRCDGMAWGYEGQMPDAWIAI